MLFQGVLGFYFFEKRWLFELSPKSQTKIQKKIYTKRLRGILVAFVIQLDV